MEINKILVQNGVSSGALPILDALVVGRMIDPSSGRKTHFWANNLSAIYELTGLPKGKSLQTHYRGGDILYRCKSALEEHLCQKEKAMHGHYVLITNRTDLDDKQIWGLYMMIGRIENAFRNMKSHLGFESEFPSDRRSGSVSYVYIRTGLSFIKCD